jgi:HK97 family phage major capsid protein
MALPRKYTEQATAYKAKVKEVEDFWSSVGDEEIGTEQKERIKTLNKEIEELGTSLAESREFVEMRERHESISRDVNAPNRKHAFIGSDGGPSDVSQKTIGEQFAEWDGFQNWLKSLAPDGRIPETMRVGNSPAYNLEGFGVKALTTGASATSAGALVRRDYAPLVALPTRPLTIRDVVTVGRTTSDLIEYPRVTSQTNNAEIVAEATATSGGSGAKPESAIALEKVTAAVKTIAHWIPVTKRALSDAAQIETLVNTFLEYGLEEELEDQVINGDGTGENFTGISNVTGTTAQAYDTSLIVTSRKGRTKVKTTGRAMANAYLMHPLDWEAFDLLKDGEDRYYFGGPTVLGNPRLWGLPVIESEACTQGVGFVGDFRQVIIWDREQTTIRMSDSHSDFFVRNMVAILAELRAAMGVFRPAAIVELDLTA